MTVNESQNRAIRHFKGPCLVLAGPGSGKTFVITNRVKYLIDECGINPEKILVITFTRAAAVEMKERFHRLNRGANGVSFGTFHSLFFKIIKSVYHYDVSSILREDERFRFIRDTAESLKIEGREAMDFVPVLSGEISRVKGTETEPDSFRSEVCDRESFKKVYGAYDGMLRSEQKLDFDDMQLLCLKLFNERKDILEYWRGCYEYILIDEFQDINPLQYKLVRLLAAPENNVFAVGDDDQSVYSFRGAAPEMMFRFEKDYRGTEMITLGRNYRCGEHIVAASASLIAHNKKRYRKALVSENGGSDLVRLRTFDTLENEIGYLTEMIGILRDEGIKPEDMAVLYRTNSEPRPLIKCLKEQNIPFTAKETVPNVFEHWVAKNINAYLEMAQGNISRSLLLSVVNRPKRYVTRESMKSENITVERLLTANRDKSYVKEKLEKLKYDLKIIGKLNPYAAIKYIRFAVGYEDYLKEYALERNIDAEELISVMDEVQGLAKGVDTFEQWKSFVEEYGEVLRQAADRKKDKGADTPGIRLMTFHAAKGLEFDTVFIMDVSEDFAPYWQAETNDDIEEERRMFYVAMTRAKHRLFLLHADERFGREFELSRFAAEAGLDRL